VIKEVLFTPVVVIHVLSCVFLILVVLLQPGKSGGLGALSGAGAQQVFGGRGAGNVLTKITWATATTFFLTSMGLAFLSSSSDESLQSRGKKQDDQLGKIEEAPVRPAQKPVKPAASEAPAPAPSDEVPAPAPSDGAAASGSASPEGSAMAAPSSAAPAVNDAPGKAPLKLKLPTPAAPAAPAPPAPAPAAPEPAAPATR
jgi:preprotein translocase subunit SecG